MSARPKGFKRTPNDRTTDYPLRSTRTPKMVIKREWPDGREDSGGSPSKRTKASEESPSDEVQPDETGTSQRVLRRSTTIQTYNRQLCRSPPGLHRPTVKFRTKPRSCKANVRPQANVTRPSTSDHSTEEPDDEQVITSSNGLRMKEFTIPLVPIERILRKSNGKFLNSYLLDKMLNQSRIDLSEFEPLNRPTTTGQQSGHQSKHTTGQQSGDTVHDRPNDHSPTSEVPSSAKNSIQWEHSYHRKDDVRPAATAESSGIQDQFGTEVRMPADQMGSPQSNDFAGLSQSPTSTNGVQNEDELLDLDIGSDIESELLNSSLNFSITDLFFALEKDAELVTNVASELYS